MYTSKTIKLPRKRQNAVTVKILMTCRDVEGKNWVLMAGVPRGMCECFLEVLTVQVITARQRDNEAMNDVRIGRWHEVCCDASWWCRAGPPSVGVNNAGMLISASVGDEGRGRWKWRRGRGHWSSTTTASSTAGGSIICHMKGRGGFGRLALLNRL